MHYSCPHCATTNRLPKHPSTLAGQGKCGRCQSALFTGEVQTLTEANFAGFLANNDLPVVVDFWASWCGPCKMMAPIFAQTASDMAKELRFAKLNTEEAQSLSTRYGIRSIPTLILFHQGKELSRVAGALPAPELKRYLKEAIAQLT